MTLHVMGLEHKQWSAFASPVIKSTYFSRPVFVMWIVLKYLVNVFIFLHCAVILETGKRWLYYQIFITADGANVPGKRNKGNVNGTGLPWDGFLIVQLYNVHFTGNSDSFDQSWHLSR